MLCMLLAPKLRFAFALTDALPARTNASANAPRLLAINDTHRSTTPTDLAIKPEPAPGFDLLGYFVALWGFFCAVVLQCTQAIFSAFS